jgi:hypothetical protein
MTVDGKIVVVGATGLIGAMVVEILTANGQQVLPASRHTGVDVLTGDGLTDALGLAALRKRCSSAHSKSRPNSRRSSVSTAGLWRSVDEYA